MMTGIVGESLSKSFAIALLYLTASQTFDSFGM